MAERIVYVGGFGNGKKGAERVVSAIVDIHGDQDLIDADAFTFSQTMEKPEILQQIFDTPSVNVQAWGHSAALLAILEASKGENAKPSSIDAIAPPLPIGMLDLAGPRTMAKTWDMHTQDADMGAVARYDLSSAAEFLAHPVANLKQLPAISRFDAISSADAAGRQGVTTTLAFMNRDRYFSPNALQQEIAAAVGIRVLSLVGMHDQLVLHPEETITKYMNEKAKV